MTLIIMYFYKDMSVKNMILLLGVAGSGMSTHFLFPWAMVPDTVEYSQWKTGIRQEGFLYGFFIFGLKVAQGFAGFIAGLVLQNIGYKQNAVQSAETLKGIKVLMTIVPCVLIGTGILLLLFYPINAAMHKKMLSDIERM